MKVRNGFVSNSSSTSFIIENISSETVDLVKFVQENPQLTEGFISQYRDGTEEDFLKYSEENMVNSAIRRNELWDPGEAKEIVFGDEDGTLVGYVYDYMLREGGESKSFKWKFHQYYR